MVEVPNWLLLLPSGSLQQMIITGSFIYMGLYMIIILISKFLLILVTVIDFVIVCRKKIDEKHMQKQYEIKLKRYIKILRGNLKSRA